MSGSLVTAILGTEIIKRTAEAMVIHFLQLSDYYVAEYRWNIPILVFKIAHNRDLQEL